MCSKRNCLACEICPHHSCMLRRVCNFRKYLCIGFLMFSFSNPKEKAKEDSKHTDIDFPVLGFHLVLPAAVKCHHSAIRGLWLNYDHFSDYCPSYDMPYRLDNRAGKLKFLPRFLLRSRILYLVSLFVSFLGVRCVINWDRSANHKPN